MNVEARLLQLLREFTREHGYTLDESSDATLQIPLVHNNTLSIPIIELIIAETPCTP